MRDGTLKLLSEYSTGISFSAGPCFWHLEEKAGEVFESLTVYARAHCYILINTFPAVYKNLNELILIPLPMAWNLVRCHFVKLLRFWLTNVGSLRLSLTFSHLSGFL